MPKREIVPFSEIDDMQPRVGRTPKERLQWALDFARRPLDKLSVGDWANLQREFEAFQTLYVDPEPAGSLAERIQHRHDESMKAGEWGVPGAPLVTSLTPDGDEIALITRDGLREIQGEWRRLISP